MAYDPSAPATMYLGQVKDGQILMRAGDGYLESVIWNSWSQLASTASNSDFNSVQKIVVDATEIFMLQQNLVLQYRRYLQIYKWRTSWALV